ncbi:MAG: hypothetical protein A2017_18015 [Lentisphaerae bacterium GWF2_44_16]|nr:MAG: hypothetical protein A2017_18015 [Lentisphaerae bacterium GWF2_44_16]
MSNLVIEAEAICKTYGKFHALNNIDLKVRESGVFGFLGPNGAGKTTLIKILLGLLTPNSGNIQIFGKDLFLHRNEIVRQVGAIVEAPVFFEFMTAYQNLYYLSRLSGKISKDKITQTLKIVGLEDVAEKTVDTYSYGMKQRLGIAQALLPENKLIFLDEPTNGLDPHGILGVRKLLRTLCDEYGITVFLSSHLLSEVEQICDYVNIINKGKKICDEKISDLKNAYNSVEIQVPASDKKLFIEFANEKKLEILSVPEEEKYCCFSIKGEENMIPGLCRELVKADISIIKISKHQKTLEEIFVSLTGKNNTDDPTDLFRV